MKPVFLCFFAMLISFTAVGVGRHLVKTFEKGNDEYTTTLSTEVLDDALRLEEMQIGISFIDALAAMSVKITESGDEYDKSMMDALAESGTDAVTFSGNRRLFDYFRGLYATAFAGGSHEQIEKS